MSEFFNYLTKINCAVWNSSKLLGTMYQANESKRERKRERTRRGNIFFPLPLDRGTITSASVQSAAQRSISRPRYAYFGQPDALWLLIVV
ncbi:hypothetical protein ANTQUA_LOCUS7763 [Anthophora quadrimaculata]